MNDKTEQDFLSKSQEYRRMPYSPVRAAVNLEAVALADQADNPRYRLSSRYDLAWAYAMGDDPAKALPVCAEFFSLLEEYPNVYGPGRRIEAPSAAMIAFHVARSLPQIPLSQCRELLQQFQDQVKRYGVGERVWQLHACCFSLDTGDLQAAQMQYQAFRAAPRDDFSDCPACEASNAAECLLRMGHRREADKMVRPVLEGALTCESQPWSVLSLLIHDDLDRGNLAGAVERGKWLARCEMKSRSDLSHIGTLLRLGAYTDPAPYQWMLEKYLPWTSGLWDQEILFRFYRGAWVFCASLEQRQEAALLPLPKELPLDDSGEKSRCAALADYFYREAAAIAQRFDRRNGTGQFMEALDRTGRWGG